MKLMVLLVVFASLLPQEGGAKGGISVWDTARASAEPLSPEALSAKTNWTLIPRDKQAPDFAGDAVATNGRILVVFRKQSPFVEVRSAGEGAPPRARVALQGQGGDRAAHLSRVAVVENGRGSACFEASYQTAQGKSVSARFRIKKGDVALETEPGAGAVGLRVECPGRFAILPDFFADDIVIDAAKIPVASAELPSENFILHPAGTGDALVMGVFENRDQDVRITVSGEGAKRVITGSEIRFGKGRKIWVGLLEGPQVWHAEFKVGPVMKPSPLEWKIPFRAQWRVDFTQEDLINSWTMLLQEKDGEYVRPSFTGNVHSGGAPEKVSVDGMKKGYHACWTDLESRVTLMPPSRRQGAPVLFYPLNRVAETPPEVFTVVDFARSCLGTGPCDYILDLESHKDQYKGRATCGVRDILGRIYAANQQKAKRDEVVKCLQDGLTFVTHIRSRVTAYLDFLSKTRQYLAEQQKAHPELQAPLAELEKTLKEMDARVAERQDKIKSPAVVAEMNEDFRKNVLDYEGPDALDRCKKYTHALVEIGGNQDELVAACRAVVKTLRQRAGILMASDPRMAGVAGEIRARTHEILRNPAWHEGARY